MKLKTLTLDHWCQHTHLRIEFPDTALARISGPNNVGKSNLIKAIGRVLAQGRSDYGDAGDIQYGSKQAEIHLEAETSEGNPFAIDRIIREKQSKVSLAFNGSEIPLTSADEVEAKLTEWFGRQDTLLSLFIASQGKISSLLKTGGKQRLVDFIEICGFKSFLQMQQNLNKFIKAYPVLQDPGLVMADVQAKLVGAQTQAVEKQAAVAALPPLGEVRAEAEALQAEKALRAQQQKDVASKTEELKGKEAVVSKPLPDLRQLEKGIQAQEESSRVHRICLQYQNLQQAQSTYNSALEQFNGLQADTTDYASQIQGISESLQKDLLAKNDIEKAERDLKAKREELQKLNDRIGQMQGLLKALKYSQTWHQHAISELQKGLVLLAKRNAAAEAKNGADTRLRTLQAVPQPTVEVLKACQATEEKLQELQQLHKHAQGAHDACPLCKKSWNAAEIADRVKELEAEVQESAKQVSQSRTAQKTYNAWLQAQKEMAPASEELSRTTRLLAEAQLEVDQQISTWAVPAAELEMLPTIIAEYAKVHEALNPPTAEASALNREIETLGTAVRNREGEKKQIQSRIETANKRMREVLGRQTKAQEINNRRAALQEKVEHQRTSLDDLRKSITAPPPAELDFKIDYTSIVAEDLKKVEELRQGFSQASSEWAGRSEQGRAIEALRQEVAGLERILNTEPWSQAKEDQLATASGRLLMHQQLGAELTYIQGQAKELEKQLAGLAQQKAAYDFQTKKLADLQAVSAFLSYDNGPQKFLQEFFRGTIQQTNLLISEMGLPVTLQMGEALEIMVQDSQKRISSSLALGGGYANLIGIAFRIALQKAVLPRVNTVILDEPSTHIDEANMEMLIPFFEKLKENLHTYGISQFIIIDHHPAWKNSSIGIIQIGANGNGSTNGNGELPGLG
jgi:exonuclease SbcC